MKSRLGQVWVWIFGGVGLAVLFQLQAQPSGTAATGKAAAKATPAAQATFRPMASSNPAHVIVDANGNKITIIDFDETTIEGKAKAPEGFLLQTRQQGQFHSVIELRNNFRNQILSTVPQALILVPMPPP